MESQGSFDPEKCISTPTDESLPMVSPSSPPPPPLLPDQQPDHMDMDLSRLAIALKLEGWELPSDFPHTSMSMSTCLVRSLAPLLESAKILGRAQDEMECCWRQEERERWRRALVNAGFPVMNPSELPGMKRRKNGRREKYYLTDHSGLCHSFHDKNSGNLKASDGTWKQKGMSAVSASPTSGSFPSICGVKKNFVFDNKPSWNMDVYSVVDEAQSIRDELVLCHVFEDDSPDYDAKPKCTPSHYASCKGNSSHCNRKIHPPSNTSVEPTPEEVTSYMAHLEVVLLGDQDTSMDTANCNLITDVHPTVDDGQSKKRKKNTGSDVWDHFTKLYARDPDGGALTYAACNHCFKVLTGDSKRGTSHLRRHTCPCKLQPVLDGIKDQGAVNVAP